MSPPHCLRRRRKKEDFDVRIGKEVTSQTQRQNQTVFIVKMYCYQLHVVVMGGGSICSPLR